MKHYLKQFTAWATALRRNFKNNMFERARMRLTVFYIAAMGIVLGIFSATLIYTLERNIESTYREHLGEGDYFDRALLDTNDGIEAIIYIVDGFLVLIIGAGSYILAGRTLRPIRESLEAQKRFSANASHDLRTPLSIIMTEGEVALANSAMDSKEYRSIILSVLEEAHVMSALVEDLLLVARSENGSSYTEKTTVFLSELLDPLVSRIRKQAQQKEISVSYTSPANIQVEANEYLLTRAFQNILQNAINYTPSGGTIAIAIKTEGNKVSTTITDTGVGIGESELPYIFDRFYKAAHSRNDNAGSGLGLPIAKEIIEQHQGSIAVRSFLKKGTAVQIALPNLS